MNLLAHLIFQHCFSCYPGAYRHDLYGDDPHLSIRRILAIFDIKVGQEIYIWIESDTDPVDEEDGESCLGGVRPVPVSKGFCGGAIGGKESERA